MTFISWFFHCYFSPCLAFPCALLNPITHLVIKLYVWWYWFHTWNSFDAIYNGKKSEILTFVHLSITFTACFLCVGKWIHAIYRTSYIRLWVCLIDAVHLHNECCSAEKCTRQTWRYICFCGAFEFIQIKLRAKWVIYYVQRRFVWEMACFW